MQPFSTPNNEPALYKLPHLALIGVTGSDSVSFLQGQLTNDVAQLSPTKGQSAGFCTPKGRLLALFQLLQRDDAILLSLPRVIAEPTIKRLSMYLLRADVTISDTQPTLLTFGISGAGSADRLATAVGHKLPESPDETLQHDDLTIVRMAGSTERFLIVAPQARAERLSQELGLKWTEAGESHWRLLNIQAGLPTVLVETQEQFVPQMLNMDLLDNINFKKGCYTGQEIIARTHYRGRVKRRMFRAAVTPAMAVEPATPIYTAEAEQPVGQVVDAVASIAGQTEMLLVLQLEQSKNRKLHLASSTGAEINLLPLPYDLPPSD